MKSKAFLRTFGRRAGASGPVLLALLLIAGCNYGFRGGGGLPPHVETVYVEPFENETAQFGLEQELVTMLSEDLPARLGVRPAGRQVADALVRGRIVRYSDQAQNYRDDGSGEAVGTSTQVVSHQVRVGVAIEIIDVSENLILWESRGVTGEGSYQPSSESDRAARQQAIEDLVGQIIDGAQSQW